MEDSSSWTNSRDMFVSIMLPGWLPALTSDGGLTVVLCSAQPYGEANRV